MVVNNAGIVKKVSFPREILALAAVGSACVFFFFQSIVLVIFLVVLHSAPAWNYLPVLVPGPGHGRRPRLGDRRAAVVDQRLPAGHPAPDRGHPDGVVLGLPIVYAYQGQIETKLGPKGLTWVYFLNP